MEKKIKPMNRSITIACTVIFVLLSVLLSVVTYRVFTSAMYRRYQEQMTSVLDYAQSFIDDEDMARCAETYAESEKYQETHAAFDRFVDYYKDLHYLYILKATEPGDEFRIRSVCSANTTYEKTQTPDKLLRLGDGAESWYSDTVAQMLRDIQSGTEDVFFEDPTEWGVDYTLARPLINAEGVHYGVLCVDISINEIQNTIYRNIYICIALIMGLGLLFTVLLVLWMRTYVSKPIRLLENSVTKFAASSHGQRDPDELLFQPPDIHTDNEVEALSRAVTKMTADMRDYAQGLAEAEETMRELQDSVFKDSLTRVNLEAAYVKMSQKLDRKIADNNAEFAIVIVDVNGTGAINRKYGQSMGDEYIVGACMLISSVFKHSPVYRVGGDDFAVVLQGRDYRDREALVESLRKDFEQSARRSMTKQPWQCYSAAIGMSAYQPGSDPNTKCVYTRAVAEMISAKKERKEEKQTESIF